MTLLGGRSRFIVLRSQRTLREEAMDTKSGVMFLLLCMYRQDKPWRTIFNRRQIWCDQAKFQLCLREQCELQSRFVGSLINASTEAFCFLVLKVELRLKQKYLGFNPGRYVWNFREATIFVILLILLTLVGNHLSKNCEGRKFSFKWSHWSMDWCL